MSKNTGMEVQVVFLENARLKEENQRQAEQIDALLQRVAELEERLRKNSRNSSKPPSSDPPAVGRQEKPKSGRKRGGQPGHKGKKRELLPPEQVDELVDVKPGSCGQCGQGLDGLDPSPLRHQVTEIPPIRPHVTEYRLHLLTCPCCGERNFGQLPEGVPEGAFGYRLQGIVALCTGVYRLSKRTIQALLADMLGVKMSLGSVIRCEKTISDSLAAPFVEAHGYMQSQSVANVDETGWREAKKKAWLWVAVTPLVTVFMIQGRRGQDAAKALLGSFAGILGTDRWSAYNWWDLARRQFCWAHMIRDFLAISERQGESARIGTALLAAAKEIFTLWHGFRKGAIDRGYLHSRAGPLVERVKKLLEEGTSCRDPKTPGTCRKLLKGFPAMWTFLRVPGVEPTNNAAEQAVRPGVLWRKGSFGTDSVTGSRFAERIMTVAATCRKQKRNVLEFLVSALKATHCDQQAPSLVPEQTVTVAKAA